MSVVADGAAGSSHTATEPEPEPEPDTDAVGNPPDGTDAGDPSADRRRRRRRWPWVLGAVLLMVALGMLVAMLRTDRAHEVTLRQAEQRAGSSTGGAATAGGPAPGVYAYRGSGTEHLSLPPLSQPEGPTVPGTVTLHGSDCWVFRLDYSSHHWQTWDYCRHGDDLWEAGGKTWQLWSVGPMDFTNLSTFTCAPGSMAFPVHGSAGQVWQSHCTGINSSVRGTTVTTGPYRLVGTATLAIGGTPVQVFHFQRSRTDSGAQVGTERADVWVDARTGLPVRLEQHLRITTSTQSGTSTYTQDGALTLTSLAPRRAG